MILCLRSAISKRLCLTHDSFSAVAVLQSKAVLASVACCCASVAQQTLQAALPVSVAFLLCLLVGLRSVWVDSSAYEHACSPYVGCLLANDTL